MMRPEALPPYVLVVAPESATKTVDYSDRSTAVLWGDGAAAAVVSARVPARARVLGTSRWPPTRPARDKVVVPRRATSPRTGAAVQGFAIKKRAASFERLRDEFASAGATLHFVGHQANLRMLESVCERCASIARAPPFERRVVRQHRRRELGLGAVDALGAWRADDDIAVVGVGAGLTWASYLVRFGDAA